MDALLHSLSLAVDKSQVHEVINRALASPGLVGFQELRHHPALIHLLNRADPLDLKYLNTLEVFCFGTLDDHLQHPEALLELTPDQTAKLRILSLLSACATKKRLSYDELASLLHVETTAEAEMVVVSAIQSGCLSGEVCEFERYVEIYNFSGRDVLLPQEVLSLVVVQSASVASTADLSASLKAWQDVNVAGAQRLVQTTTNLIVPLVPAPKDSPVDAS